MTPYILLLMASIFPYTNLSFAIVNAPSQEQCESAGAAWEADSEPGRRRWYQCLPGVKDEARQSGNAP